MNLLLSLTQHFKSDYSMILAIMDFVPVALFLLTGIVLMKNTYTKLSKWGFAFLSSGVMFVTVAGLLKAIWKIICSLGICDFVVFNLMLFPLQMFGYIFFMIAMFELLKKNKAFRLNSSLIPLVLILSEAPLEMKNSSIPFLAIETIASSIAIICLIIFAFKNKETLSGIFTILAFVFLWGMGGLAALDGKMNVVLWNWIEEIVNTLSQLFLLLGVYYLSKKKVFERI